MTSSFSFSFSGDDIEGGEGDTDMDLVVDHETASPGQVLLEPRRHSLEELISTLPSRISYNVFKTPPSPRHPSPKHPRLCFPRREVFDIRAQLMAEEDEDQDPETSRTLISGLEQGDINSRVYEGGFKTWECAIDLTRILLQPRVTNLVLFGHSSDPLKEGPDVHVIELGAGTAMPSTSLLQYLLTQPPPSPSAPNNRKVHFTLCDYNLPVLALASFPNLLLSHTATSHVQLSDCAESDNDLDITEGLLSDFRATLSARNITINFISGAWGPQFVELVRQSSAHLSDSHECLVLASETIYSPSSLPAFTSTLSALLQTTDPDHCEPVALIAAKRIYFGVGGGVADFISQAREEGLVVKDKWATDEDRDNSDDEEDAGVARVVMEVRRAETTVWDSGPHCHRNVEE